MKRLHEQVSMSIIATAIAMAPFAWVGSRWLQGNFVTLFQVSLIEVAHPQD